MRNQQRMTGSTEILDAAYKKPMGKYAWDPPHHAARRKNRSDLNSECENSNQRQCKFKGVFLESLLHLTFPPFAFSTAHINDARVSTSSLPLIDDSSRKCRSAIPASTPWSSSTSAKIGVRLRVSSSTNLELRRRFCSFNSRRGLFAGVVGGRLGARDGWRNGLSREDGGGGSSAESGEGLIEGTRSYCVRYRYSTAVGILTNSTCL